MISFKKSGCVLLFALLIFNNLFAKDSLKAVNLPCILFPTPMDLEKWKFSIGINSTTTPEDITEEVRLRIPVGDFHMLRKLNSDLNLNCRVLFQVLQNQISFGLRWATPLSKKYFLSVGDDLAFWFGKLKIDGFDSKGFGLLNYPNVSVGFKTNNNLLFTIKTEAILNLYDKFYIGNNVISSGNNFYSGSAFTFAIEQPFYNKRHLTLAFTAIYTDFFWQTWSLFETFNRNIFYPQISVGFIL